MQFIKILFFIIINANLIKTLDNSNPNIAVFPFKTFYYPPKSSNEQFSSKEYMDTIQSSLIYLDIEIGKDIKNDKINEDISSKLLNNKQFISLFLVVDNYDFYIDDNYFYNEEKKKICHYSTFLSTSYEEEQNNNITNNMKEAVIAADYLKVYNDKNLNNKCNYIKISFRHKYDKDKNIAFACGSVGLLAPTNQFFIETKTNFINQIHESFNKIDYSFSIQYNNKDNLEDMDDGILIIGEESLEKKQNQELIPIYAKPKGYGGGKLEWEFNINQITIGNKIIESDNLESDFDILIKSSIDGIQIPYFFYQELNSIFFNKYYSNKICQFELVNNLYVIISCDSDKFKKEDILSFPEINFLKYKLGFNFTFTGKELFVKKGNKYFFKMVSYFQKHLHSFNFGRLFLKMYKVIFNSDSKAMYFLDVYKNKKIIKNDEIKNNRNITLLSFSYIFIGIVFLVIGIFFGRRYCLKKRKLYANELEDDNYIYDSGMNKQKNGKKLMDM